MKTLSLKLDDNIFDDAETITAHLKLARNRYINEAVNLYNKYNKRQLLKSELNLESNIVREESMSILSEFEMFVDEH